MIMVAEPDRVDADLVAGRLHCPRCPSTLRPWAHAAPRRVRQLDGTTRTIRPRGARCRTAGPRRCCYPDRCCPAEPTRQRVIGAVLLAKATGRGGGRVDVEWIRPRCQRRGSRMIGHERCRELTSQPTSDPVGNVLPAVVENQRVATTRHLDQVCDDRRVPVQPVGRAGHRIGHGVIPLPRTPLIGAGSMATAALSACVTFSFCTTSPPMEWPMTIGGCSRSATIRP